MQPFQIAFFHLVICLLGSSMSFSGLSQWVSCKESAYNDRDMGLIPKSGRYPLEGDGNSLQYSCLANLIDREVLWTVVHRVAKESVMTEQLNNKQCLFYSLIAHFFLMKYCNI